MSHSVGVKDVPSRATKDADVVARIREAGGIPLLVSNTPELCMWWHTFNKVTGSTKNPYDTRRSPGGSSGGEAALLGAGASILSLVSDIAGSARLPALFCGVFGHKPTPYWISVEGHKPDATDKNWPLFFAIGLMVRYATDLPLLLSVMSQSDEAKIIINNKVCLKNIRFFYMDNYGPLPSSMTSDVKNAIYKLMQHLNAMGIKVERANLEDMKRSFEMSFIILLKIKDIHSMFNCSDDPKKSKKVLTETLKYFFYMSPHSFPAIAYGILRNVAKRFPDSSHKEMMEIRMRLRQQFEKLLGDDGVLICPSFISSAYYPQECLYNINNFTYMMIFNVLGFPVTQCPLGFDKNQMPIGLQIVANPGCDHLTIAVAQEIEKTFGGWQEPQDRRFVSRTDFLSQLRRRLLLSAARKLNCNRIFLADSSVDVATKVLGDVCLGRGAQLSVRANFCDARYADITILKPMRDFMQQELIYYSEYHKINSAKSIESSGKPATSIQALARNFTLGLESQFSGTVSTIFRTADKISPKCDVQQNMEDNCVLCDFVRTNPSGSQVTAIRAIEISKLMSSKCVVADSPSNKQNGKLNCLDLDSDNNEERCNKNAECSCKNNRQGQVTAEDVLKHLCYSCTRIFQNSEILCTLPSPLLSAVQRRIALKNMRDKISDFLL